MRAEIPPQYAQAADTGVLSALLDVLGHGCDSVSWPTRCMVESRWLAPTASATQVPATSFACGPALDALGALVGVSRRRLRAKAEGGEGNLEGDTTYRARIGSAMQRRTRGATVAALRSSILEALGFSTAAVDNDDLQTELAVVCSVEEWPVAAEQAVLARARARRQGDRFVAVLAVGRPAVASDEQFRNATVSLTAPGLPEDDPDRAVTISGLRIARGTSEPVEVDPPITAIGPAKLAPTVDVGPVPDAPHTWTVSFQTGFDIARFDTDGFDDPEVEVTIRAAERQPASVRVTVTDPQRVATCTPSMSTARRDSGRLVATRLLLRDDSPWIYAPDLTEGGEQALLTSMRAAGVRVDLVWRTPSPAVLDREFELAATQRRRLDVYLRELLAEEDDPGVRAALVTRSRLWDRTWHAIVADESDDEHATAVLLAAAARRDLSNELAATLAEDRELEVRRTIAARRTLPAALQVTLAQDSEVEVRLAVAQRTRLSAAARAILLNDPDPRVRSLVDPGRRALRAR